VAADRLVVDDGSRRSMRLAIAREMYGVDRVILVAQHFNSIAVCKLGVDSYGLLANRQDYDMAQTGWQLSEAVYLVGDWLASTY
jgi:hypothetical protein